MANPVANLTPAQARVAGIQGGMISRTGGTYNGALANWAPMRVTWREEGRQREVISDRANDLVANDAHACSLIEAISVNTVGPGLRLQSKPNAKRLGITDDQASAVAEAAEWEWERFCEESDVRGVGDFYSQQFQNCYSLLTNGEFLNLPLMLNDPSRRYSLALQVLDPCRMRTPYDLLGTPNIRDGIRLGKLGEPTGYMIMDPVDPWMMAGMYFYNSLPSVYYNELPPRVGHRPTVIHKYIAKVPEQVRGVSILAPAMNLFKSAGDYIDYELLGAILAASFPVFIERQNLYDAGGIQGVRKPNSGDVDQTTYQEFAPAQIYYGNPGEKPHILKNERPGSTFQPFMEVLLRAVGASGGMPYEITAKDFSKTNYSSARAALQEAWRYIQLYQKLMIGYCHTVYRMQFEEAFLRGRIRIPKSAPDFYGHMAEWCDGSWIGPERTNVDPVKEMIADLLGLKANVITLADIAAKRNKDWESQAKQRAREKQTLTDLELDPEPPEPVTSPQSIL